ncbi:MAG TPA: glutamate--tRNA ligase [Steroidobacteraceae bacterium]|nr:glutamate--tRNA ligase [Steroidobacteraceae bacterium]
MDSSGRTPLDQRGATRFAPSPTGEVHLGNARTALFNFLLARHAGARFLLRIEDTDTERSRDEHTLAVMEDLRWLGLDWDAGPDREDERGPYRQSQRRALYQHHFEVLERQGVVYPCFCSPLELEISRKAQLAAGRPPRYAGTCRALTPAQRERKRAQGIAPSMRFHVPLGRRIEFTDFVHGPQSFLSDDIGDFVLLRADGSAAFFFSNAIDDATMGVTEVLRGEDHLTNTPRQLLILSALGLPAPRYGHLSLIVGADGAPLSKRHGATSVREYRERGYRPEALTNHLFRLGHSTQENGFLSLDEMARAFDLAHFVPSPARFDEQQLNVWQKEAAHRLPLDVAGRWLSSVIPAGLDEAGVRSFLTAVLPNIVLPDDVRPWVEVVFGGPLALAAPEEQVIRNAGNEYFAAAAHAAERSGNDLQAIAGAVRAATGKKGAELYMPLRVALTGRSHGPELAPLLKAMPPGKARERLARFM